MYETYFIKIRWIYFCFIVFYINSIKVLIHKLSKKILINDLQDCFNIVSKVNI